MGQTWRPRFFIIRGETMNQFKIQKKSLIRMVHFTIDRNKDIEVYHKKYIWKLTNDPIRIRYTSRNTINVDIDLMVRFGVDLLKAMEKASQDIKNSVEKLSKIQVKSVNLAVKELFHGKEDTENH